MSTIHKLLMTVIAATLFTAAGASAAVNQSNAQLFEKSSVQAQDDLAGVDRLKCMTLKRSNLEAPAYCIYR